MVSLTVCIALAAAQGQTPTFNRKLEPTPAENRRAENRRAATRDLNPIERRQNLLLHQLIEEFQQPGFEIQHVREAGLPDLHGRGDVVALMLEEEVAVCPSQSSQ